MSDWNLIFSILLYILFLQFPIIVIAALLQFYNNKFLRKKYYNFLKKQKKWPHVSIIIPVYNEEKVIKAALDSVLDSNYPFFEIIIVDDGSKDNTIKIINNYKVSHPYEDIKIIENFENQGKAISMNLGIICSNYDYIITIDADTRVSKKTIKYLILPLLDPKISAVTCNLKVGNRSRILTKLQSIEYVIKTNTERRLAALFNSMTTLVGCTSAYRKSALESVGYFSKDTLVEDTDLAITFLRNDQKLVFEDKAVAFTEVPFSLKDLYKQRIRWLYGNVQAFYKHRYASFKGTNWLFRFIFFPRFVFINLRLLGFLPFVFLIEISLILLNISSFKYTFIFLQSLISIDVLLAIFCYIIAEENKSELIYYFLLKLIYPCFLGFISIAIILHFLNKKNVKWDKIKRSGQWVRNIK